MNCRSRSRSAGRNKGGTFLRYKRSPLRAGSPRFVIFFLVQLNSDCFYFFIFLVFALVFVVFILMLEVNFFLLFVLHEFEKKFAGVNQ